MKTFDFSKVAEITIQYSTNVKASERPCINSSTDAYNLFIQRWDSIELFESVKLLLLNRANRVLGISTLSAGGTAGCIVDPKIVFQYALKASASGIILVHNHPSGNIQPSDQDKNITQKIKSAGEFLDIKLLDHLIISPYDGYLSFTDEGLL